jgi:2-hydroxychromene-2-carboxylate isomerase
VSGGYEVSLTPGGEDAPPPEPSAEGDHPVFVYDLRSPDAYLAAERVWQVLGEVPEFRPVLAADLPGGSEDDDAVRCAEEASSLRADVELRARERGLQPLRWPARVPADTRFAMQAATYAKGIGKVAAFTLAAFRQAFAGGRDLSEEETVLIAAAACEMHPAAVIKGARTKGVAAELERATADAAARGVRGVPAVIVGERVFHGDIALEAAARALRERRAGGDDG